MPSINLPSLAQYPPEQQITELAKSTLGTLLVLNSSLVLRIRRVGEDYHISTTVFNVKKQILEELVGYGFPLDILLEQNEITRIREYFEDQIRDVDVRSDVLEIFNRLLSTGNAPAGIDSGLVITYFYWIGMGLTANVDFTDIPSAETKSNTPKEITVTTTDTMTTVRYRDVTFYIEGKPEISYGSRR